MLDLEAIRERCEAGGVEFLHEDIPALIAALERTRAALAAVLDSVDYTAGNCRLNEQVGAVLPQYLIIQARDAL